MSNPFAINEKPVTQFGILFLNIEEKQGSNGNYYQFNVTVGPLGGGDLIERKYFNFAQTPSDTKIFLDGLNAATNNQPMTAVNPDGAWVEYQWETFRDYGKKTVKYYEDNNPDKLQADEKGRFFVEKGAIKLLRMFRDENECILAHDNAKGIENPANGSNPFATNGNGHVNQSEPADMPTDTALAFIGAFVKQCRGTDNKVNRDMLATMIAQYEAVNKLFTVDSPQVVQLIEAAETEPAF